MALYNEQVPSICRQPGHSRRICPNQPIEHGRAQRVQDQLIEDSDSASFSDWSGCSDTTSEVIEVDQLDQGDQFDIFWTEQQQWIYDHEVQDQGAQLIQAQEVQEVQEVQDRRYLLRLRYRTEKAAAIVISDSE